MTAIFLRRVLSPLIAALALTVATAAAAIELPDEFRDAIEQGVANGRYQSVIVGLIDHDERGEWQFGAIAPDGTKPVSADAYEIGSTTRTFTGLLLARALLDGKF